MPATWTAPRTWVTNEVVNAALMNTHVRDNFLSGVPAGAVMYYATSASAPSGYVEYALGQGRVIVGLPTSGSLEGTVGTALTNQENRTHTHTGPSHGHPQNYASRNDESLTSIGITATNPNNTAMYNVTVGGGISVKNFMYSGVSASGAAATSSASTSQILPYLQLLGIQKT